MSRIGAVVALLACLCCERAATPVKQTAASSTASAAVSSPPVASQQNGDALEENALPEFRIVAPDSSEGDWYLETGDLQSVSAEFLVGSHVRRPSGLMVIWFDTAVRATDDHGVGRARADSVVVEGMQHLEYLARFCVESNGLTVPRVVGLVTEADTTARPRLAWRFNAQTFRIERYPVDSVRCMVNEPVDEVD
ncbi:MAG: hypothetical protein ACJ8AK_13835 [Gemmatimonadaceae bacterium]